jgi:hypothetical protein
VNVKRSRDEKEVDSSPGKEIDGDKEDIESEMGGKRKS